ncbi:branched-chain-amino-acid aminotransferase [Magnaporthiopsis poae ATCC 64411]|uniref:Branched-chain-amino-acid aminotransferase n=1 Tax=Magnaporthiopsis poae (strain ATCC 64411 / 73-15) TaxID=644358 RepID=A0A0C4DZN5_MAGP6|nr:branched-chain-amino-acid aminotransferase [Magnaporthiopsis poae ATCC 64411]
MAPPVAITPVIPGTPVPSKGSPDTNLTAMALEHKLEEAKHDVSAAAPGVQELDASKLIYKLTATPRTVPDPVAAVSGSETICTDHMITANWNVATGWSAPSLHAYGPLSLMPTASVLHYATECFEGLKVYRGYDGKLRLFRPDRNAERMLMSSVRISLPTFPPKALEQLMLALMAVDGPKWLPRDRPGSYLYLRPTMIGTQPQLGAQGRLVESFAAGTAFFVTPVSLIHHRGKDAAIGMGDNGEGGKYTLQLKQWLKDIMYGNEQHEWGVVVQEEQ